jgi:hypothetical protein
MKFSEQVVLGSTLIKFKPEIYLQDGCGCFIGMAAAAMGNTSFKALDKKMFEWLFVPRLVRCPHCCQDHGGYSASVTCMAIHVENGTVSFNEALAYIRSIEPPDAPEEADAPDTVVPVWNRYNGVPA